MVTGPAPPHTVTNIGPPPVEPWPGVAAAHRRRILMQQDTRADRSPANTAASGPDLTGERGTDDDPGMTEELLVEEISIDGMCGVY
jgi:mycofactocin precursor